MSGESGDVGGKGAWSMGGANMATPGLNSVCFSGFGKQYHRQTNRV